jgi:hypothetical protein
MSKHADLDARILAAVKDGKSDVYSIWQSVVGAGRQRIDFYDRDAQIPLRSRLKALRQQGAIDYNHRCGWHITEKEK